MVKNLIKKIEFTQNYTLGKDRPSSDRQYSGPGMFQNELINKNITVQNNLQKLVLYNRSNQRIQTAYVADQDPNSARDYTIPIHSTFNQVNQAARPTLLRTKTVNSLHSQQGNRWLQYFEEIANSQRELKFLRNQKQNLNLAAYTRTEHSQDQTLRDEPSLPANSSR